MYADAGLGELLMSASGRTKEMRYHGKYRQMEQLMMKEVLFIIAGLMILSVALLGFVVQTAN